MTHLPRLTRALRLLLQSQRVAALGTISDDGSPFVSMVPFAIEADHRCLVIHISSLAAHTRHLQATPAVSLLVMQSEVAGAPVHALPRVTLQGMASEPAPGSHLGRACREAYLARFPEAEPMTTLADFKLIAIDIQGARQVAGFGSARSLDADEVKLALGPAGI